MSALGAFLQRAGSAASSRAIGSILGPYGSYLTQATNKSFPVETWSPGDLINAITQNQITFDWFQDQMLRQGFDVRFVTPDALEETLLNGNVLDWNIAAANRFKWAGGLLRSFTSAPSLDQTFELLNRQAITPALAKRWIGKGGYYDFNIINTLMTLANEIPAPNELIDYAQSGLLYSGVVANLGLQNEFPELVRPWIKASGFDWPIGIPKPPGIGLDGNPLPGGQATWADLKWWNHWRDPGLTDVYTMFQRLYSESPYGPSPLIASAGEVSSEDVSLVQSRQAIARLWRKPSLAISFVPFNKREIQRLFNYDVANESDVYHTMRFNGYTDANAQQQVQLARLLKRDFYRRQKYNLSTGQICNLYQTGVLTLEDATNHLRSLDYSDNEVRAIINNCDLEWQKKLVNQSLKYIKDAFLYGVLNEDGIRREFMKLGVAQPRVEQYIHLWKMQRDSRFKETRASEILKWVELGIITSDEGFLRLTTMGYLPLDAQKMLIVVGIKVTEEQTKALAARNKAIERELLREQKAKAKEKQVLAKEEKDRIKALLVASTPANLKAWIKDSLITDAEATDRLALKGWPQADIERFLEEAHKPPKAKGKSNASTKGKAQQTTDGGSASNAPPVS